MYRKRVQSESRAINTVATATSRCVSLTWADKFYIFIPAKATPKGRPRLGKFGVYTPKQTVKFERTLRTVLNAELKACYSLMDEPLSVELQFIYKAKSKSKFWTGKVTRPDLDNLIKSILDSANGILWKDDSQIVKITARKFYGEDNAFKILVTKARREIAPEFSECIT